MNTLAIANGLGWAAAAVFAGSYFCRRPESVRRVQMLGALMWVGYGVMLGAVPVVVANLLVLSAAAWTSRRSPAPPEIAGTAR